MMSAKVEKSFLIQALHKLISALMPSWLYRPTQRQVRLKILLLPKNVRVSASI